MKEVSFIWLNLLVHKLDLSHSLILFLFHIYMSLSDLLPDDGECDWAANELPCDYPRLLAGCDHGATAAGSNSSDLAQVLPLSVHLHDLPVCSVRGHPACTLHRYVTSNQVHLKDFKVE